MITREQYEKFISQLYWFMLSGCVVLSCFAVNELIKLKGKSAIPPALVNTPAPKEEPPQPSVIKDPETDSAVPPKVVVPASQNSELSTQKNR